MGAQLDPTLLTPVHSAPRIDLSFMSFLPPDNPREKTNIRWIEKIEHETDNRVRITPRYERNVFEAANSADALAPVVWQGWRQVFDRADISIITALVPGTPLPISRALKYFVYGADLLGVRKIYRALWQEFPELRNEYSSLIVLGCHPEPEFLVLSKRPVPTLDAFEGLKLTGIMGEFADLIGKLGAVFTPLDNPRTLAASDVDGLIFIKEALMEFGISETTLYGTRLHTCNPPLDTYVMSPEVWNQLPSDIQKAFDDNRPGLEAALDAVVLDIDRKSHDYAITQGHQFLELSREDRNRLFDLMRVVALREAGELDAQGLPGTKIFRETRRLVEEWVRPR